MVIKASLRDEFSRDGLSSVISMGLFGHRRVRSTRSFLHRQGYSPCGSTLSCGVLESEQNQPEVDTAAIATWRRSDFIIPRRCGRGHTGISRCSPTARLLSPNHPNRAKLYAKASRSIGYAMRSSIENWRKRVGVEPTIAAERRRSTVLKTAMVTGPPALP